MRREEDFDPGKDEGGRERITPEPVPSGGVNTKWVAAAVAVLLLVIFAVANFERVQVNFLVFSTKARLVTVIVVSGLLGFLAGWFIGRPGRAERKAMRRGMDD
jgi:uncharacterized integral membrane protein